MVQSVNTIESRGFHSQTANKYENILLYLDSFCSAFHTYIKRFCCHSPDARSLFTACSPLWTRSERRVRPWRQLHQPALWRNPESAPGEPPTVALRVADVALQGTVAGNRNQTSKRKRVLNGWVFVGTD